jgi:hypothetical protein
VTTLILVASGFFWIRWIGVLQFWIRWIGVLQYSPTHYQTYIVAVPGSRQNLAFGLRKNLGLDSC